MAHPTRLLNRREVADLLGIKLSTLAHLHHQKRIDLPYALIGGSARYRLEDVEAYIERNTSTLTRRYRGR